MAGAQPTPAETGERFDPVNYAVAALQHTVGFLLTAAAIALTLMGLLSGGSVVQQAMDIGTYGVLALLVLSITLVAYLEGLHAVVMIMLKVEVETLASDPNVSHAAKRAHAAATGNAPSFLAGRQILLTSLIFVVGYD